MEHTHRPRWSPRRRVAAILALIVLLDIAFLAGGVLVGGYELLSAQHQMRGGSGGKLAHADATVRALHDKTVVAGIAFGVARVCWWPWRPLADLIAVAPPLRAAGAIGPLLDLATDGSAGAAHALDGAAPVLAATAHSHGSNGSSGDTGPRLLTGLQRGHGSFAAALNDVTRAERDAASIDVAALPAPAHAQLSKAIRLLPDASDALRAALVAPQMLGADKPRSYLIVPENPWDLRATGGFVGTAALLEVNHGRLTLSTKVESSTAVDDSRPPQDYVPPPLPLTTYQHLNSWFYRDANWSPDYPTSAQLLRYFYWLGQHTMPDGVVAFDSSLLGPLLQITGPVTVPGIAHPLTAANGVTTLDHYVNAEGTTQTGLPNKYIAALAYDQVFTQLKSLSAAQLPTALSVLGTALRQKHLLLWSPNPTLRSILARHHWDGAIDPTRTADYLYVVDTNVHYNKINQLVHKTLSYHAVVQPDRSLHSTLTISYTNTAYYDSPTATNLPFPQNNALYEDFVRVYVPLGSKLLGTTGLTQQWATTRDHDKTVFNGYLRIPSRGHLTVTFSYVVPPNADMSAHSYQLTVQKQPGTGTITNTIPLAVDVSASTPGIRVGGGTTWGWRGLLDQDVTLAAPLQGGHPTPAPLAYDAAPVTVAPGARIAPWAVLPSNLPSP